MPDSITTDSDWSFDLTGGVGEKPEIATDEMAMPWVANPMAWAQYSNKWVYEADCIVRALIESQMENPTWCRTVRMRRYTLGMVVEIAYGRPYDCKVDAKLAGPLAKVLAYYSSRVQTCGSINGKTYSKRIYTLSPKRFRRRPAYSLRLRLELMSKEGILPDRYNMRLPLDNLTAGHARNPRTDANMERRREESRRRYNERYADRAR